MEQDKIRESQKNEDPETKKDKSWVEKAEDWMDEKAEKIVITSYSIHYTKLYEDYFFTSASLKLAT